MMLRRHLSLVVVLTLGLALGACATGPKFTELESTFPTLEPSLGRIFIYRTAILGAAVQPSVKLNGEVVGSAVPNGFFFVDRSPGDYTVSTTTEVERSAMLGLRAGEMQYVRLNIGMGFFVGRVTPELIHPETGAEEIKKLSFSGGPLKPPPNPSGPGVPGRLPPADATGAPAADATVTPPADATAMPPADATAPPPATPTTTSSDARSAPPVRSGGRGVPGRLPGQ
jgi:hypothetical protein